MSGWDSSTCFHFWKPMGTVCFLPSSMSHAAMAGHSPAPASMPCATSPMARQWEKTLSQMQTQLTPGTGVMPHSPANFKLLKFMPFPRFWTWFLFLSSSQAFLLSYSSPSLSHCIFSHGKTNSCRPAAVIYKLSLNANVPWTIISLQFTGTFKVLRNIFST